MVGEARRLVKGRRCCLINEPLLHTHTCTTVFRDISLVSVVIVVIVVIVVSVIIVVIVGARLPSGLLKLGSKLVT